MDDNKLITDRTTREMTLSCRRASELLEVPIDELSIFSISAFTQHHRSANIQDGIKAIYQSSRRIKSIGLTEEIPSIMKNNIKKAKDLGYRQNIGVVFFEHWITKRKYILYNTMDRAGYEISVLICCKCDTVSILKHLRQKVNEICDNCHEEHKPILSNDILTTVINSSIGIIQNQAKLDIYGVKATYGILLNGEAGNGKTMLCRYIKQLAKNKDINYANCTASQIEKAFQDNSLYTLFGPQYEDTILFFDDIDISYLNRNSGNGKIACSILSALDGVESTRKHGIIRIFTTNEDIDSMDKAFVRPGRIDKVITLCAPDTSMRLKLITSWHKDILSNINVDELVAKTEGKSFAQLNAIRTALVMGYTTKNQWDITMALQAMPVLKTNSKIGFQIKG